MKQDLRPTCQLRIFNGRFQQLHKIFVKGYENDGFDGGESWETMVDSGRVVWKDVEVVNDEENKERMVQP